MILKRSLLTRRCLWYRVAHSLMIVLDACSLVRVVIRMIDLICSFELKPPLMLMAASFDPAKIMKVKFLLTYFE